MRLVTYRAAGALRAGVLTDAGVVDAAGVGPGWTSVRAILGAGPDALRALAEAAPAAEPVGAPDDVELGPPIPDPDKIVCLGLNYRDHAEESGLPLPATPLLFAKFRNSLAGPDDPIVLPARGEQFDYEAELAVVIGVRAKDVAAADALEHVAGVMAFNDVTARDVQHATSQWTAGKAIDTFAPCGPCLVTLDEIGDVQDLRVRAAVNGVTVQDGTTRDMIFGVAETIAFVSSLMTLEPGDVIATGTPAGVGISRDPQVLLGDGDVVEVDIEGVGTLRNRVVGRAPAPVTPVAEAVDAGS
jgi:2-keto-4-pentenoate hydratase/2-oxohepta-3-ene-1,7-dioic acid hydratase in catechol pathway